MTAPSTAEHGTYARYALHLRHGEAPCEACKAAQVRYQRVRRQQARYDPYWGLRTEATRIATHRLVNENYDAYSLLLAEELDKLKQKRDQR